MHVLDITIDHTKVPADLTDFPVLIVPASSAAWDALYAVATASGGDIRCFKAGGSVELPREIVSFSISLENGEIFVKYSGTLSSAVDTVIEVHADGTSADYAVGATYGRNAVWSDYLSVIHGKDITSSTLADSTGNSDGTKGAANQPNQITGKIAEGQNFGTTSNQWRTFNSPTLNTGNAHSWQMWIKPASGTVTMQPVSYRATTLDNSNRNAGGVQTVNPSRVRYFTFASGSGTSAYLFYETTNTFTASSWNYIHVERNGSNIKIKINSNTPQTGTLSSPRSFDLSQMTYGYGLGLGSGNAPTEIYGGEQDEMRLRNGTLSDDWTATEYNNQNTPATFYEVTAVGSSGTEYTLICDPGTLTIAGDTANLSVGRTIITEPGSFTIDGGTVALPVNRTLTVDAGTFVITAPLANVSVGRSLVADLGIFSISSETVTLSVGRTMDLGTGSFTLTGGPVSLARATSLILDPGSFTLDGSDASLRVSYVVIGDPLGLTISAPPVGISASLGLSLEPGALIISGGDIDLVVATIINPFCPQPRPFGKATSPLTASTSPLRKFPPSNCD